MSTKQKAPLSNPKFTIDNLGIVTWSEGQDPFDHVLSTLETTQDPDKVKETATTMHSKLTVARGIAVSLFGDDWDDYVFAIYDRLVGSKDPVDPSDSQED